MLMSVLTLVTIECCCIRISLLILYSLMARPFTQMTAALKDILHSAQNAPTTQLEDFRIKARKVSGQTSLRVDCL